MQDNKVCAFRQRLLRAGFKDVSIGVHNYFVYLHCLSPNGDKIKKIYSYIDIERLPIVSVSYLLP